MSFVYCETVCRKMKPGKRSTDAFDFLPVFIFIKINSDMMNVALKVKATHNLILTLFQQAGLVP